MKRFVLLLAIAILLLATVLPATAHAQASLTVSKSTVKIDYPMQVTFSLSATGNANISDVRLRYSVDQESFAQVISEVVVPVAPSATINTQWVMDMRKTGGFPPGTTIRYWWVVKDVAGGRVETNPTSISFADDRYRWQNRSEGMIDLYWYNGGDQFADEIMSAAQDALAQLAANTGAQLKKTAKLYIYASSQDLQGALIFPYEWAGGLTFSQYGTIAIGISPSNLNWGKGAIAHELSHLVVHQVTNNPYSDLPRWLDEGLAMYNEGLLDVSFGTYLKRAVDTNSLISVRSLASPFSAIGDTASLSYAESFSVVAYLISTHGESKMLELLNVFSKGSRYDDALMTVYGFDSDGLNARWKDYVNKQFNHTTQPAVALVGAGAM